MPNRGLTRVIHYVKDYMQNVKVALNRKCFCFLLLGLFSTNAAADSIFDGVIPCAKENKCGNQPGGFYADQPGALDGSRVTSYGSADTQAKRDLSHSLVNAHTGGTYDSATDRSKATGEQAPDAINVGPRQPVPSVQCSAAGEPLLGKICSTNEQQDTR